MTINRIFLVAGAALLFSLAACDQDPDQAGLAPPADSSSGAQATLGPNMIDLRVIENPEALQTADVADRAGEEVGFVERIEVDAEGTLTGLIIELEDGATVRATPMQAGYDESASRIALIVNVDQLAQAG